VCVPQLLWRHNDGENMIPDPARSQLHCLRQCNSTTTCPPGSTTVYECNNSTLVINRCTDDNCVSDDRPKEGSTMVTVCVNDSEVDIDSKSYCVFDNVDPEVEVLQRIIEFVTGEVSLH